MNRETKIIATLGPASSSKEVFLKMVPYIDMVRLNFSWENHEQRAKVIEMVREVSKECGKNILIVQDLSGPRVQTDNGHHFDGVSISAVTEKDLNDLDFGIEHKVDYVAVSYVGGADDITKIRMHMNMRGTLIPIIAKIERREAVKHIEEIVDISDAIMIARGDLGEAFPIEELPFIEKNILSLCNEKNKFVIVATEMMLSMVQNERPTRAEVTDVAYAVINKTSAVMLSEESARGVNPPKVVEVLDRIVKYAEANR